MDLGELTGRSLDKNHPLLEHPNLASEVKGIIATEQAPMLIVVKPFLTNDREDRAAGAMIMGRFLNTAAFERLAEQAKLALVVLPNVAHDGAACVGEPL